MKNLFLLLALGCTAGLLGQKPELVVPMGNTQNVCRIAFSPDGKYVVTGGDYGIIKLWNTSGNELHDFNGHLGEIISLVFSPDSRYILSGGNDQKFKLWDLRGKEIQTFEKKSPLLGSAVFSPDGKLILTCGEDTTRLWDLQGNEIQTFAQPASFIAFSPDGHYILTVNSIIATLWDLAGNRIQTYGIDTRNIDYTPAPIGISPDLRCIAFSAFKNDTIRTFYIWDLWKQEYLAQGVEAHTDDIYSMVFSPDGQQILTASTDGTVKLWDLQGRKIQTFAEHSSRVLTVAFSSDGQQILSGCADRTAKLWDLKGRIIKNFNGHASLAQQAQFSPDGKQILTVNQINADYETVVSFWDIQGRTVQIGQEYGNKIRQLDVSPDGKYLFAATLDSAIDLHIWDWLNNQQLLTLGLGKLGRDSMLNLKSSTGYVIRAIDFAYSSDGQHILTALSRENIRKNSNLSSWPGRAKIFDLQGIELSDFVIDSTYSISIAPDRKSILTIFQEEAKLWNWQGKVLQRYKFENDTWARFGDFSPDGKCIVIGSGDKFKTWDLNGNELQTFNGHTDLILNAAFSPNGQYIATAGMDKTIRLWDLSGNELQIFTGHTEYITNVAFSPNGRYLITSGLDKTVKLWDINQKKEIATLVLIDSTDWIITTTSGLFDASPGAMNLMYYSVFYERHFEYLTIEVEQLKARYYEPGLLQKLLGYSDEPIRPIENFDTVALYPNVAAQIEPTGVLYVRLRERNGGIGKVSIFINGKEVAEEANPLPRRENAKRDSSIRIDLSKYQNYLFRHPDSTNTITIRAYNEEGWLQSPAVNLDYKIAAARSRGREGSPENPAWVGEFDPKLYVITIGTSDYSGTKLDLQYGDQDATMMAKALQAVGTALVGEADSLEVHCLTTAPSDSTGVEGTPISWQPSGKSNIRSVFEHVKDRAKAEDIVIVYLSGHGVTQGGTDQTLFYYLTKDVASEDALADPVTRREYAISSEELTKWLTDIPALKQVLIIDACNSGQIVENLTGGTKALNSSQIRALDRMKDRTGMFVLSGSAADKVSYEAGEYGQGLLTYALLQGMLGVAADKDKEGKEKIDVMKLFQYARDEVPKLAGTINGIQTPMLGFPNRAASFDIGLLDENAKAGIPISNKKQVVIKSVFMNKNTFLDELQLAEKLESAFREETAKGSAADLIYVDVYSYPGAYSIRGMYELSPEGDIRVDVKLFKDQGEPVSLEIRPTDDPERLVRYILRAMKQHVPAQGEGTP